MNSKTQFGLASIIIFAGLAIAFRQPKGYVFPPPIPATFYGVLTLNGSPASDGTIIDAQIDGVTYATAVVFTDGGQHGLYQIAVPGDDPDTPNIEGGRPGDVVNFLVTNWVIAETGIWNSGVEIQLDLNGFTPTPTPTPTRTSTPTTIPSQSETPGPGSTATRTVTPTPDASYRNYLPVIQRILVIITMQNIGSIRP